MDIRLTAQLVISEHQAILAYSTRIKPRGPNGESHSATILATSDAGQTWSLIPLQRTFFDRLSFVGFPTWPPEAIMEMSVDSAGLQFEFRDEWVPFAKGGECLWRATQRPNGKRVTSRIRDMDYEVADTPGTMPGISLKLPTEMAPPSKDVLERLVHQNAETA